MQRFSLFFLCLPCFFFGCMKPTDYYCVEGAQEFVIDSYKIKQGKLSILELQGIELQEICWEDLQEYIDTVHEDDILNIAVWHPTRRDLMESIRLINDHIGFRVKGGYVDIPDIPEIYVEGLTLDEAREAIESAFLEQIKEVEVFISYKDRLSRKVELSGLVATHTVPVDGKIRLYEVLTKAHVPNHANLYMSYVLRNGCQLAIDLDQLLHKGDLSSNIVMRGGDKIFIADPMDSKVMMMGEVLMPKPLPLPAGTMSLREALVSCGGIPFTGDRSSIQVIRGNMTQPRIYLLSWDEIVHLPNDSLLLMPGDTVYVRETPITQWNRFISQLMPSFGGVQTAGDVLRTFAF